MPVARTLGPDSVFVNAAGFMIMEGGVVLDRQITSMAVRDGLILALGTGQSIRSMAGGAPVVDLEGGVVMPGLIDCHNHFLRTALGRNRLQLEDARSIDQILELIGAHAKDVPPGEWLLCSPRWHETNLQERRMPTVAELDRVASNVPVYLPRGGHVVVTNSLGLRLAGVARRTARIRWEDSLCGTPPVASPECYWSDLLSLA